MQQWLITKLLSYDFVMEYERGVENRVVDSISQKENEGECALMLITVMMHNYKAKF